MVADRTSQSVRAYNIFKFVVTLILILIIIILLLRARAGTTSAPQGGVEPAVTVAAPTLSTPKIGDDGTVTLSGTGTPGSKVEIWAGGKRIGEATVGADGKWSFAAPLEAGDYDFTVRAVDASGKTLAESAPLKFTVPALVKAPTLDTPTVGDDGAVTLSGTGTPGSKVEIWAGGKKLGEVTVGADGKWSFAAPSMEAGDYDFSARAVDASGKTLAESAPLKFTVPALVKAPTLDTPKVGDDGTLTLSGKGTPGSKVEIWAGSKRIGEATVGADGTWSFAAPSMEAGDYDFSVRAVDASGKTLAESEPLKFTVPALALVAPTFDLPKIGDDGTLTLSGKGTPGSKVEIWAGGKRIGEATVGADGTWSFAAPSMDAGDYDFSARVVDASGATLAESEPLKFTVPSLTVAAPTLSAPQASDDGTVTLSGTGTPGSKVEIWAGGKRIGEATVGADGKWSFAAPLEAGDYDFSARAVDASGKTLAESAPLKFTVPALVKAPTLTAPLPNAAITGDTLALAGTGEPGAEVEILDNGKVVGAAVVQADGTWEFDYKCEPGVHSLTVQNTGDAASASETVNIEVAAAAPPTPAPKPAAGVCSAGNIPMGVDQGTTYIVARCEYMALIAQRTGVKLADLIAANPQVTNPNLIYPDQVLNLPPR